MKKVLFSIIIFSFTSFADVEERRDKILKLIDSEVQEISRLVKQTRGSNPNFILRLSELYFEQARLLHERELDRFKNLSSEQKDAIDKKSFYAESRNKFENAQKTAKFLLKNYPRYPQKGDVYYILAKNSMEFQDTKSASDYFSKAYSTAGGNAELKEKAGVSMAENYYNNKKYAQAIPLYEKALVGKKDKWWTKDAYNLSWCYYRTHNYSKAINLMHEVHKISKQDGFVNFAPQVERDLAFFYTSAGRTDEAIRFYRELGVDIPSKLIAVSKFLKEIGKFTDSEKILILALNNNPNPEQESEIYATLLDYYEKYGLYQKHLNACKRLADLEKRGKLSSEIHETLVLQAQRVSGTLQRQVAEKTYEKQPEVRRSKGELAIEYFKILLEVDPKNNEKWNLAIAETLRTTRKYEQAIPFYFAANKSANEKGDTNIANLSVNGLMLTLDNPAVSKTTRDRYTISAYSLSLKSDPKSQKALTIYQRIFSYYISKGMISDAEKILMDFKENFPGSTTIQEAMIAKIIDYYKNTKNYAEVERWSKKVASGEYNVSQEYNKQVRLQFVSTKLEKATNKGQALEGYLEIYNNDISPRGSKVSAAYNISVIYFEIGDPDKTFQWTEKALSLANANEISSYASSYQAIGKDFFGRRQFERASIIYDKLLRGICSQKNPVKQEVFAELIFIDISQKDFQRAHDRIENFKQCGISETLVNSLKSELLEEMVRSEEIGLFQSYLNDYLRNPQMSSYLIKPLGDLRNNYLKNGLLDKADQVKSQIYGIYHSGLKAKVKYSSEAKDLYASLELENLRREVQRMASINLVFPENEFQARFKDKFTALERIISSANQIASLGSGQATISAFKNLSYSYRNFSQSVIRVVPTGKSPAFIESFRKAMSPYTNPFTQKAQDLENRARKIINDNDILSKDNAYFLSSMSGDMVIEYNFPKGGIPMDRSGSP